MTQRQIAIAQSVLTVMRDLDGGQAHQISIHGDANLVFRAMIPKNEFDEVFDSLNRQGAFLGVTTKFKGVLWSLTPKGEQIRLEMA